MESCLFSIVWVIGIFYRGGFFRVFLPTPLDAAVRGALAMICNERLHDG